MQVKKKKNLPKKKPSDLANPTPQPTHWTNNTNVNGTISNLSQITTSSIALPWERTWKIVKVVGTVLVKSMAIAATIFVPLTSPICRRNSLTFTGSSSSSSTIQLSFPKYNIAGLYPRFHILASAASSMSTLAPQKASTALISFLDSPKPQSGKKNKETRKMKLWDQLSCRATWLSRSAEIKAMESGGFKFSGVNGFMGSFLFSFAIWVCNF